MRYVSIDIETTGLSSVDNQMIEIGLVVEDTRRTVAIDRLPYRRILIPRPEYQINTYCMEMHRSLFKKLDTVDWSRLAEDGSYRDSLKTYFALSGSIESLIAPWLAKHLGHEGKYVVAGKNFYSFDYNFLKQHLPGVRFHQRCLDPCILYLRPDDTVPPDMAMCCERAGINIKDYHTAVGDARTVVQLLRGTDVHATECLPPFDEQYDEHDHEARQCEL